MAADSTLDYDDIVDARWDSFAGGGVGAYVPKTIGTGGNPVEVRTVPNSAPYTIKLFESPQQNTVSTTDIIETISTDQLNEVSKTTTPGDGEYRVNYDPLGNAEIEFNVAQGNVQMDISYYGLGTVFQKDALDSRVPSTGDTTIDGVKTFTDTTASTSKDTGAVVVEGGIGAEKKVFAGEGFGAEYRDSAGAETTVGLHPKIIEIGAWDMNVAASGTSTKIVAHGISDYTKIRTVEAMIRNDGGGFSIFPIDKMVGGSSSGSVSSVASTNIVLSMFSGGWFDTVSYDDTGISRGFITVWYQN